MSGIARNSNQYFEMGTRREGLTGALRSCATPLAIRITKQWMGIIRVRLISRVADCHTRRQVAASRTITDAVKRVFENRAFEFLAGGDSGVPYAGFKALEANNTLVGMIETSGGVAWGAADGALVSIAIAITVLVSEEGRMGTSHQG